MKKVNNNNITKIKWSRAMSIEELSKIYNIHRNTMSKWLKEQVICNRQLSPRKWQIAKHELPDDYGGNNVSDIA